MGCASLVLPEQVGPTPSELLEFVALPSEVENAPKQLSGSANELVRSIASVIDGIVLRTMEERTAEGFAKARMEGFPQYFAAMVALGVLIKIAVPERDIERLRAESLSELEADFRDSGAAAFGTDLRDRGLFTVWTLRKISDLAHEVENSAVPKDILQKDNDVARKFATHAIWARFHIDCLVKSMKSRKPIFPGVVENIADGLRAAVDAYAWIRQAVGLRTPVAEPQLSPVEWTPDDELLLKDSMRDMDREES